MKATRVKNAAARAPRRWRTPPPLTRGSAETLEGMEILREENGELAILLWQSYRNVMFWATAEPAERAKLFSPEASRKRAAALTGDVPAALAEPLLAISRMLGSPEKTRGDDVAEACSAVAAWANDAGHTATALAYTQAAALAAPRSAELAFAVGKLARTSGELARAETWFRHAIMISRQIGDWDSYGRAYLALGNMALQRGNLPLAARMHIKALRSARRKGLTEIVGYASHDLFVVATETNRPEQAEQFARQAFRAYGPEHSILPTLAHDVAYFWMNQGRFARALPVFEAVLPKMTGAMQFRTRAHLLRAAGGAGDRDRFRRLWNETIRYSREPEAQPFLADGLLEMAHGAASLGEWDRAEQTAERALQAAAERNDNRVLVRAEWVLDSIRHGRSGERALAAQGGRVADQADALAQDMVRSLGTKVATSV